MWSCGVCLVLVLGQVEKTKRRPNQKQPYHRNDHGKGQLGWHQALRARSGAGSCARCGAAVGVPPKRRETPADQKVSECFLSQKRELCSLPCRGTTAVLFSPCACIPIHRLFCACFIQRFFFFYLRRLLYHPRRPFFFLRRRKCIPLSQDEDQE